MPATTPSALTPKPCPGVRLYHSAASVWLNVDPLAENTPGVTPYAYCVNNPIRIIDPDGRDWFENEKTGDVYYSRDYHQGDEHLIDGEGWKWMGENGMFGKSDHSVISDHYQQADVFSGDDEISRAAFTGDNAWNFMGDMGYDKRPLVQDVYVKEVTQTFPDAMGPNSFSHTEQTEIVDKTLSWTYAKKTTASRYNIISRKNVVDKVNMLAGTHTYSAIERREYNYTMSSKLKMALDIFTEALNVSSKIK